MRSLARLAAIAASTVLAGCTTSPGLPGNELRVIAERPLTLDHLEQNARYRGPAERARDASTRLADLALRGRVVMARCAMSPAEVIWLMAVLPSSAMPAPGSLLRLRLGDARTPDIAVGPVVDPPALQRGVVTHAARDADPAFVDRHYFPIRGAFVLRCTQGD